MDNISSCRAAYVIPFIDVLRGMGAPVDRELTKAKLPTSIEDAPDEFVSNLLCGEFVTEIEKREGIDDLGWLFAKRFSASNFSLDLMNTLTLLPTVKARIDRFSNLSKLEDSDVNIGIIKSDGGTEVFCDLTSHEELRRNHISEWVQVAALIEVIRSVMGKSWSPDEIRFKNDFNACRAAREANPNTRFIKQSAYTSIIIPSSVLAANNLPSGVAQLPGPNIPDSQNLSELDNLKRLVRPYLLMGPLKIDILAEIVGVSRRSLQRKLQQKGTSYSELIKTTRFEMAIEMLRDPDIRVIDVATMLGYEDQSNFGRSFRNIAGISAGKFRHEMFNQEHAD